MPIHQMSPHRSLSPIWWGVFAILMLLLAPAICRSLVQPNVSVLLPSVTSEQGVGVNLDVTYSTTDNPLVSNSLTNNSLINKSLTTNPLESNPLVDNVITGRSPQSPRHFASPQRAASRGIGEATVMDVMTSNYIELSDPISVVSLFVLLLCWPDLRRSPAPRIHADSPLFTSVKTSGSRPRAPPVSF